MKAAYKLACSQGIHWRRNTQLCRAIFTIFDTEKRFYTSAYDALLIDSEKFQVKQLGPHFAKMTLLKTKGQPEAKQFHFVH